MPALCYESKDGRFLSDRAGYRQRCRHSRVVGSYFFESRVGTEGPVSDMVWGIDYLVADLSRHITLVPGDVVLTGTPWYSRPMAIGDVVEVDIEGVGRLSNTIVEGPAPSQSIGHQAVTDKIGACRGAREGLSTNETRTPRGQAGGLLRCTR